MKTIIRCSADAKQCVVMAVLKKNGEASAQAGLPPIEPCESCDHYYARCRRGMPARLLSKALSMAVALSRRVTGNQTHS